MKIKDKVMYILANYPETRDNKSSLFMKYMQVYDCDARCITTVDREARIIQNNEWLYQPSLEIQKARQKHSAKKRDEYRNTLETSIVKRENKQLNMAIA